MTNKSKEQHIIDVITHYMNGGDVKVNNNQYYNLKTDGSLAWNFGLKSYEIVKAPKEFEVMICGDGSNKGKPCRDELCDKMFNTCQSAETITMVEKL